MPTAKKLSAAQLAALATIVKHGRAPYTASHRLYKRPGFSELVAAVVDSPDGVLNTRSVVALVRRGLITLDRAPGQRDGVYHPTEKAYALLAVEPPSTASTHPSGGRLDRTIASAIVAEENATGVFYLTNVSAQPLGPEFSTRRAAKRAALKLVREGDHTHVAVWQRWRGDRYMQGQATAEGWTDV